MFDYMRSFEFVSMLALFVYWTPLFVCGFVYVTRAVAMYRYDLSKCDGVGYNPTLTIGIIVWWSICTLTPCANLLAMVFDCAASVFKWLGKTLDMPLVPKKSPFIS